MNPGVEHFMKYDYVGAPWAHILLAGGNGGLSLRNVRKTLLIIHKFEYKPIVHGNEDLYFCRFMAEVGGVVPTTGEGMKFSVETMFYDKPVGIHAAEKYISAEQLQIIFDKSKLGKR